MEERSLQVFIPYERSFNLVSWEEEWLMGLTSFTWNFGSAGPHWSEIADFEPILTCSASAVTPIKKSSVNTNRKSITCFPMSLRWSSYVAPENGHFLCKIALHLKKVCYKVSLRENCQRQSCKAFIGLTIRAQMIGGDVPFYLKIWWKMTHLFTNRRFSIYFRS